jgi:Protein of unknown function (DUF3106)
VRQSVGSSLFGSRFTTAWVIISLLVGGLSMAAPARAQPSAQALAAPKPAEGAKPRWHDLNPAQREALKALEREWPTINADGKQKWLAIAAKYPSMSPQEQTRLQARMSEWARLSPKERGLARQQFQAAKRVAPQDRPAQWEAYQALPAEQRRTLAARAAAPAAGAATRQRVDGSPSESKGGRPQAKSNIVPNPAYAVQPTPVTTGAMQAQPGATTTSMAKRAAPPAHQQTGLPKIAASPGFVDKTTLLPKRGPQGAAIRSIAASEPNRQP